MRGRWQLFRNNIKSMKISKRLISIGFLITFIACNKNGGSPSAISLLQNKWTIYSESTVMPYCSSADRFIYIAPSGDYFLFDSNDDSVKVSRSGNVLQQSMVAKFSMKYLLLNDSKLITHNGNSIDTADIIKLTSDSLVFVSPLRYSFLNLCTSTIMTGTAKDTFRLYR